MVVNAISLDTIEKARYFLGQSNYLTEIIQVQIAVHINKGRAAFWQSRNPVTIISAEKQEESK